MRMIPLRCVMVMATLMCSCSNPSTPAGYVGYVVYEAIKAQLAMVSSPNHTVMYIPVGPMGVPLVGIIDMSKMPPSGR